jgi:ribosomal protein S27AE
MNCPKCGSEMGFVRGFALTPESSLLGPQSDDYVYFNYTHPVCPKCGHEEKVKP